MKLQKVEKLDKKVISSFKIYMRPFTSVIRFERDIINHILWLSGEPTIFFSVYQRYVSFLTC